MQFNTKVRAKRYFSFFLPKLQNYLPFNKHFQKPLFKQGFVFNLIKRLKTSHTKLTNYK